MFPISCTVDSTVYYAGYSVNDEMIDITVKCVLRLTEIGSFGIFHNRGILLTVIFFL